MNEVNRPWGKYVILKKSNVFQRKKTKTKILYIKKGKGIRLQRHNHREEHWVVLKGRGKLILNSETKTIFTGEYVHIKKHDIHKIIAIDNMEILEVQVGEKLTEKDLEVLE